MDRKIERLNDALMDAFSIAELEIMLRTELNKDLADFASGNKSEQVFDVVQAADRQGWIDDLGIAAFRVRSGNDKVAIYFDDFIKPVLKPRRPIAIGQIMNDAPYSTPSNYGASHDERMRRLEDAVRLVEKATDENRVRIRGVDGNNGLESKVRSLDDAVVGLSKRLDEAMPFLQHLANSQGWRGSLISLIKWVIVGLSVAYGAGWLQ